jgi:N-acetylglucosaminyldiphosphoundecaprenol N-acetyl-beta-D-mannosaminyltransferase
MERQSKDRSMAQYGRDSASVEILGCPITKLCLKDVVDKAEEFIASRKPHYIAVVNVAKLIKMRHDQALEQSVCSADIIGADGVPLVWTSRLLGDPLPGRVNGTDLMIKLLERANEKGYRIFFFGATEEILRRVLDKVRTTYPGVKIAGAQHGYFSPEEEIAIARKIRAANADILFIGFSTPKKELWIKNYLHEMQVPVCHGVGGSFDVFAGLIRRAPIWMQKSGLEWLFRLLSEPRRLWKRYLTTNTAFFLLLAKELLRTHQITSIANTVLHKSKRALGRNPLLSMMYHEARLRYLRRKTGAPIIVYQMGKVGSRTVVESLKKSKVNGPIFHVHFLNKDNIEQAESILKYTKNGWHNVNNWCLYESNFLTKNLVRIKKSRIKIICLIRDPIARNISSFFENIDKFIPRLATSYDNKDINVLDISKVFFEHFHEHDLPLIWFDTEMKKVFGIDIFSRCFPKESGYCIYREKNVEVLIVKTEYLDRDLIGALKEFLLIENVELRIANSAHEKSYRHIYQDFISHADIPRSYIDKMYTSKLVSHFYTKDEIDEFRRKWLKI